MAIVMFALYVIIYEIVAVKVRLTSIFTRILTNGQRHMQYVNRKTI